MSHTKGLKVIIKSWSKVFSGKTLTFQSILTNHHINSGKVGIQFPSIDQEIVTYAVRDIVLDF